MSVFKGCWWTFIFNPQSALARWLHSLCVFMATGRRRGGLHTQLHWLSGESSEGSAMPKSTRVVGEIQAQYGNLKRFDPVSLFLQSEHFPLKSFYHLSCFSTLCPPLRLSTFIHPALVWVMLTLGCFLYLHNLSFPSFLAPFHRFCIKGLYTLL